MKSRIFWGVTMIVLAVALILGVAGFNFWLPEGIATWQLILAALCILSTMAALHLSRLGGKGIGAMFKGFFKLIFKRR